MARRILVVAALMGALGVVLGAFGAHGLESAIKNWPLTADEQALRLATWDVAVRYQMYHVFALLATGILAIHKPTTGLVVASAAFVVGTLIFSGCLYALVLSGVKILGAVVPLGGLAMIVGWVALALSVWRMKFE